MESVTIILVSLAVGLLTLISMIKIWSEAFWKPAPVETTVAVPAAAASKKVTLAMFAPIVFLTLVTISMGLWPEVLLTVVERAAEQLLDPREYVHAVLEIELDERLPH